MTALCGQHLLVRHYFLGMRRLNCLNEQRTNNRVVIGSLVSAILLFYIPTNLLGILGGLCLGLCTSYKSKTIFNCVGAIMAASMIFGLETSLYLRILLNMLGLAYGLLYHFVFVKLCPIAIARSG